MPYLAFPALPAILLLFLTFPCAVPAQSLAEALDTPELTWKSGGDPGWEPFDSPAAHAGSSIARLGPFALTPAVPGPDVSGWMETTVTGPGMFRVFVKFSRHPDLTVSLSLGDTEANPLNQESAGSQSNGWSDWSPLTVSIPAGPHAVRVQGRFAYSAASYYFSEPVLQADSARFYPSLPAIGEAFDAPSDTWFSAGEPGFVPVTDHTHDGTEALHAPAQPESARLETRLTGPATVSWWRQGVSSLTLSGQPVRSETAAGWIHETFFVGSGEQWVRWDNRATRAKASSPVWLDEFTAVPSTPVSMASALNAPGISFHGEGWQAHRTAAASDGEAHAWTVPDKNQPAWLETFLSGPALVTFTTGGRGNHASLEVSSSGLPVLSIDPAWRGSPRTSSIIIPQGSQNLRWQTQMFRSDIAPGLITLDQVRITPLQTTSVTEALDAVDLSWRSPGTTPWSAATSPEAHDSSDFAYSPAVQPGQYSILETTVTGPGTFSFWWISKTDQTGATFSIPGTPLSVPVPGSWTPESVELPPGRHTLRWQTSGPAGAILLDETRWEPGPVSPVSLALDLPPALFHFSGDSALRDTATHFDGVDSLRLTSASDGQPAPLTFWVDGPATLECRILTSHGFLQLRAGANPIESYQPTGWEPVTARIRPGRWPVTLTHDPDSSPPDPGSASWVDSVTLTSTAIPLAEGLSAAGFPWRTNPDNPWSGIAGESPSAAPGPFSASDPPSWLENTLTGPAVVSFSFQGTFLLSLDSAQRTIFDSSGPQPTAYSLRIPPGTHTLHWEPTTLYSNPWSGYPRPPLLLEFRSAPLSGVPTLVKRQDHFLLTVARPVGYPDSRLSVQQADFRTSPFFQDLPQPLIESSTPDAVTFRIPPPANAGPSLFFRARYR